MRVGLLHFGQSVDFVVSITFLRSPVLAILAIFALVLLLRCLCSRGLDSARGFNGAAAAHFAKKWSLKAPTLRAASPTRSFQFI
jgi:hypothetical protein